jgi:hypothetical protein
MRPLAKGFVFTLVAAAFLAAAVPYLRERGYGFPARIDDLGGRLTDAAEELARRISAPPPLRATDDHPQARLTASGVLSHTNARRAEAGIDPLDANAELDAAAEAKLADMFAGQYFAHDSPDGYGPDHWVDGAGYAYVAIGENLALGGFKDDAALVQAWMDSPGHRANILEENFTEIGIAVGEGTFEGRGTWLAVQMFGKPLSACPQPDETLAAAIEEKKALYDRLVAEARQRRAEIESTDRPRSRQEADEYNAKVDEYNALVARIDALREEIGGMVDRYNAQVRAFNACAGAS